MDKEIGKESWKNTKNLLYNKVAVGRHVSLADEKKIIIFYSSERK